MTEHDPLDDLLGRAFEADRARHPAPDIVTPVMRQIRRRQRARTLVLGGATAAGLLLTLGSGLDLTELTSLFRGDGNWLAAAPGNPMVLIAGLLAAVGGILAMEETAA